MDAEGLSYLVNSNDGWVATASLQSAEILLAKARAHLELLLRYALQTAGEVASAASGQLTGRLLNRAIAPNALRIAAGDIRTARDPQFLSNADQRFAAARA